MGWWSISNSDMFTIGDGPADILEFVLEEIGNGADIDRELNIAYKKIINEYNKIWDRNPYQRN